MEDALAIEPHYARWYAEQGRVDGVEAHVDPGVTWVRLPVPGWGNGGVALGLEPRAAEREVRAIAARFEHGLGFWVGPAAPDRTEEVLRRLGFRCRKRFPAMVCADAPTGEEAGRAVVIRPVRSWDEFGPRRAHPHTGPVTTAIRRFEMARRSALCSSDAVVELGAYAGDELVGACLVFTDREAGMASVHDVAVLAAHRCRGIGRSLVAAAVRHARERGCRRACLISTAMGEGVYRWVGFVEVTRIAYWYRGRAGGRS